MENLKLLMIVQVLDFEDPVFGFLQDWILELNKNVKELYIIALFKGKYRLNSNVKVFSLGKEQRRSKILYILNLYRIVIPLARKKKIDGILVFQGGWYPLLLWIVKKLFKLRLIQWKTHSVMNVKTLSNFMLVDKILTASYAYSKKRNKSVKLMGHAINTDKFIVNRSVPKKKLIIVVGRTASVKRNIEVIEIFEKLVSHKDFGKFELEFIGVPTTKREKLYFENLLKLTIDKGLSNIVHFRGEVTYDELPHIYNEAHLSLSMGSIGSLDKVILESMACGTPVIMRTPSIKDQLGGYMKLLYADDDDQVLRNIKEVINMEKENYLNMGNELRKIVIQNHSLNNFMKNVIREFQVHKK